MFRPCFLPAVTHRVGFRTSGCYGLYGLDFGFSISVGRVGVLHQGPEGWFTTGTAGAPQAPHTCKENTQCTREDVLGAPLKLSKT